MFLGVEIRAGSGFVLDACCLGRLGLSSLAGCWMKI